ncbi:hypothetical protein MTO96_051460 [Rhipicephalus appendiculatus]
MKCSVLKCKSYAHFRPKPLSFHRFPKDPDLRRKWISAIGRDPSWAPTKYSTVCSEHFSARDFMTGIPGGWSCETAGRSVTFCYLR